MNIKILSWNVRGLNDRLKRKLIKSVVRKHKVDLWCIQETKMQVMSEGVVRSLSSRRFIDWRALNAIGTAGGVLICWDKRSMEILEWEEGQFSISCKFRNVVDGVVWVFTGIYGPLSREERECLWEDPWCLGGDFNTILYQSERSRNRRITSVMRRFAQIIDDLGLVNFPLQGGLLDRFLATPSWCDQYSRVSQRRLPRPTSDHFPILLEGGGARRGSSPFRFENMWLKVKGFIDLIRGWWHGLVVRGSPSYRLAVKMKELKQILKVWNREVFGNLERNKGKALQQVEFWDSVEGEKGLTEEELNRKKDAKEGYAKWVIMEETHWRQLSREIWLKEGDRNTGTFIAWLMPIVG
ncbi:hypothetical protein PVL29_005748 [Vitis rotundifolia]|uniref:Endonuclease/exonuclease/phosphatase domain-containing protein n=1 Tax=Vitis rotundifolia TaxID=103349 RepID=A0AA39A511_VITRO|nr:hypothetical protein PVL29_005748 [Vitis rotundifolia]